MNIGIYAKTVKKDSVLLFSYLFFPGGYVHEYLIQIIDDDTVIKEEVFRYELTGELLIGHKEILVRNLPENTRLKARLSIRHATRQEAYCFFETCDFKLKPKLSNSIVARKKRDGEYKWLQQNRPLTLFVGSCYQAENDNKNNRSLKEAYRKLPKSVGFKFFRPHANLFLGDQVYLDNPVGKLQNIIDNILAAGPGIDWALEQLDRLPLWPDRLNPIKQIKLRLTSRYERTFSKVNKPNLYYIVNKASNYFFADDHEFWNNYPFTSNNTVGALQSFFISPAIFTNSRTRKIWKKRALLLYKIFQRKSSYSINSSNDISMLMLDVRLSRTQGDKFLTNGNFNRLEKWIADLKSPGILVMSQILFAKDGNEENLPKFNQYKDVVRLLRKSRHDIVFLSGDVHFGRVASTKLNSECRLIEIVTSPLKLVDSLAAKRSKLGNENHEPSHFPHKFYSGIERTKIDYHYSVSGRGNKSHNNCCVLKLNKKDNNSEVELSVQYFTMKEEGNFFNAKRVMHFKLK